MLDHWTAAVLNGGEGMLLFVAIVSAVAIFVIGKIVVHWMSQEPTKPSTQSIRKELLNDSHIFWLPRG